MPIITVKIWPLEANVSANQTVTEGDNAKFFCIVTNDKTARIQWLRIRPSKDEKFGARPKHDVSAQCDNLNSTT